MNNVFLLVKLYHIGLFKGQRTGKSKFNTNFLLVLISLLMFVFLFSFMSINIADILTPLRDFTPLLALTMALASFFTFFNVAFKGSNLLFQAADEEFILSLPISFKELMISKIINIYSFNFLLSSIIMAPAVIVYGQRTSAGLPFYLMSIIGLFIVPLFPVVIAAALNVAFETSIGDFKGKKFLSLALSIVFSLSIVFFNQKLSSMSTDQITSLIGLLNSQINKIFPLASYYANALNGLKFLDFSIFVLGSLGLFALFSVFTARYYHFIRERLESNVSHVQYKGQVAKGNSLMVALLKKEFRLYFSSPVYVMNTILGPIFMLIGAFLPLFNKSMLQEILYQIPGDNLSAFMPALFAAASAITTTTPFSLSLEGQMYDWLKSLPIRPKDVFNAKILLNLMLIVPASLLASLIFSFSLSFSPFFILMNVVLSVLTAYYVSQIGILINLSFPKFDFINHNAVVKQSMAGIVSLANGFFLGSLLMFSVMKMSLAHLKIYYIVVISLLLILNLFVNFILKTYGYRTFYEIGP